MSVADLTNVSAGEPAIRVISAMPGGMAEQILRKIADAGKQNEIRHPRFFQGEWQKIHPQGILVCSGVVMRGEQERIPVTLKIGVREGLFLDDASKNGARGVSMKPVRNGGTSLVIPDGLAESRVRAAACQIVAVWILRNPGWQDSRGSSFDYPYGQCTRGDNRRNRRRHMEDARRRRRAEERSYMFS